MKAFSRRPYRGNQFIAPRQCARDKAILDVVLKQLGAESSRSHPLNERLSWISQAIISKQQGPCKRDSRRRQKGEFSGILGGFPDGEGEGVSRASRRGVRKGDPKGSKKHERCENFYSII